MTAATVLTIGGAKGGAGKTVTAINVASALRSVGFSVALVDADLGTTNVADVLELDVEISIHEVLAGEADVEEAIVTAETGLDVLSGGDSIAYLAEADPAELRTVIDTLSGEYDTVIVDTGTGLSHEVLVPFGLADGVALVSTPNDTSIVDTRKTAEVVEKVDGTLLGVVVNRVTDDTDLERVREQIELPLLELLPNDPQASKTEPVVMKASDTDLAGAYRQLATTLHRQVSNEE
ncbi:MinD/ParA family ATP-binding protein [Halapricum hydrolyticum]|uniref:P-loop NTPase n=1 Tax=Halapricum hydrolyticum TaxID=2979991 RepID=A0AAE3IC96_9EURY|nr:P-loop NTPase [Halapricum hydrolyticum]MCU4716452.1 P-loop NTPase [Halapricum hydrolyticum]MCU4725944.1 P-loop NTPase [Halapricum hydrolyticum]